MKRVCFITPSLEKGGMERVLTELANYGAKNMYAVYIINILPGRNVAYELDSRVTCIEPEYGYEENLRFKIRSFRYLKEQISKIKPQSCLSFSESFNPLAVLVSKLNGVPIYISDRSNPLKPVSFFKRFIKRVVYPKADGMIAQTSFAQKVFQRKKLNSNIITIANPLRALPSWAGSKDASQNNGQNLIVSVGRLVPSKNFAQLIRIFAETASDCWELIILGEGRERPSLESLIKKLKLCDRVKLLGQVDDVDAYFSRADVFAFTSLSEGFPNALSEAMGFPLACISFDCPAGPADIIDDGVNGMLIPINNEESYRKKLSDLMKDSELRDKFKLEAYKNREKFSTVRTSAKYFNFILDKPCIQ